MSVFAKNDEDLVEEKVNKNSLFLLQQVKTKIHQLQEKHPWIIPGLSAVVLIVILLVLILLSQNLLSLKSTNNQNNAAIRRELNDVSAQLQALSASPQNSAEFQSALTGLHNDISSMQKTFNEVAKSTDIQQVSHQITSMKDDVDAQMLDIKRTVSGSSATKQYIDASILPFHIISIDVIAQQPFVSVNYSNHTTPLAVGDALAGWTIVSADYETSTVELKNANDQYVKITVEG